MRKESIIEMIDKRIIEELIKGLSLQSIRQEIENRINNMSSVIKSQNIDLDKIIDIDFDQLSGADFSDEKVSVTRVKYTAFYIKHSRKRLTDLDWIESKGKRRFPQLSKSQVFKLIKLKEKISKENSTSTKF